MKWNRGGAMVIHIPYSFFSFLWQMYSKKRGGQILSKLNHQNLIFGRCKCEVGWWYNLFTSCCDLNRYGEQWGFLDIFPLSGPMYAHVSHLPMREWLEEAHGCTSTKGYSRIGYWETFEVETFFHYSFPSNCAVFLNICLFKVLLHQSLHWLY